MTYSKKGTFLKRTTVGTASLLLAGAFLFGGGAVHPIRQTMAHWHEEMIIPIIIKMEVKKLINGVYTPDSVHLSLPFV